MNKVAVRVFLVGAFGISLTIPVSAQVLGPSLIYTENFDSMGAAGTSPPAGWQVFQIAGGSSTWINGTGSNSLPAIGAIPNGSGRGRWNGQCWPGRER